MVWLTFDKEIVDRLKKELELAEKLNNLRLYKIVTCLLLIQEGEKFSTIARQLNICCRTVYDWFKKFMVRRFSWLLGKHYKGRGRKPRLNDKQKKELYDAVVKGPEACGYDRGIWNSAMIAIEIEKRFGVTYSPRYVCSLLKGIGLSYQKAKFIPGKTEDEDWQRTERGHLPAAPSFLSPCQ